MEIDLTNPSDFTIDNVRSLLESEDVSVDRQLRVTEEGIAYLSHITGAEQRSGLRFRMATWDAGISELGNDATANEEWIFRVFSCLKMNWPNPTAAEVLIEPISHYR